MKHCIKLGPGTKSKIDAQIKQAMHCAASECLFVMSLGFGAIVYAMIPGQVPVIRAPRGNAAEMVATKLDKKLRDNIRDMRHSLFNADVAQAGQFR